ncbi:MAG TPA: sigma-54 dependent transcriptional regulator [Gemmataceae bacterium]|jgi:DNA-binding NtrC family response regulator|nr:sigma-54 dependent transcriptional regulator [Gemmataceae bacterium]
MNAEYGSLLVVDDDETNRDVLGHRLQRKGYSVTTVENGYEALELIRCRGFDLVLLDIMMPGISGLEVLKKIRQTRGLTDLPVVMATARDQSTDVVQALELGANDYVTKPYDIPVLLARVKTQLTLKRAVEQIGYLQEEIKTQCNFEEIIGASPVLRAVLEKVRRVAPTETTVLILGETGTGKELVARAIHDGSSRRAHPLVKVNCGAISPALVESELFGHEEGAFTGARERRIGRFELAHSGTIFLDEVGELTLETQVKLLQVIQEKQFERVGSSKSQRVDVRVIAATNRNLAEEVKKKSFREDLYYRLHVVPLTMPPLRERPADIPLLVRFFLTKFGRKLGKQFDDVELDVLQRLQEYPWPGNVRELQNTIERAAVLSAGPQVSFADFFGSCLEPAPVLNRLGTLEEAERAHLVRVLQKTDWVIEGKEGAAAILGLRPSTLRSRMQKLGIRRKNPA